MLGAMDLGSVGVVRMISSCKDMLGIASRTLLFHRGDVGRKLQADYRAQMIARAISLKVAGL